MYAKKGGNEFETGGKVAMDGGDPVLEMIAKKKMNSRIKTENIKNSTAEYLEKTQPVNSKRSLKTAVAALESVILELHPSEDRSLIELPKETLAQYLEEFFQCVVKADGTVYNASTLGTYFNSLARFLMEKKQIDIKKDPLFGLVGKVLARRQVECASEGDIPGKNAAKAIPKEVLAEVIAKGKIGFDDPRALTANVVKSFQAGFGTRNREEMYSIQNGDIDIGPLKMNGIPEYLELSDKLRRQEGGKGSKVYFKH